MYIKLHSKSIDIFPFSLFAPFHSVHFFFPCESERKKEMAELAKTADSTNKKNNHHLVKGKHSDTVEHKKAVTVEHKKAVTHTKRTMTYCAARECTCNKIHFVSQLPQAHFTVSDAHGENLSTIHSAADERACSRGSYCHVVHVTDQVQLYATARGFVKIVTRSPRVVHAASAKPIQLIGVGDERSTGLIMTFIDWRICQVPSLLTEMARARGWQKLECAGIESCLPSAFRHKLSLALTEDTSKDDYILDSVQDRTKLALLTPIASPLEPDDATSDAESTPQFYQDDTTASSRSVLVQYAPESMMQSTAAGHTSQGSTLVMSNHEPARVFSPVWNHVGWHANSFAYPVQTQSVPSHVTDRMTNYSPRMVTYPVSPWMTADQMALLSTPATPISPNHSRAYRSNSASVLESTAADIASLQLSSKSSDGEEVSVVDSGP